MRGNACASAAQRKPKWRRRFWKANGFRPSTGGWDSGAFPFEGEWQGRAYATKQVEAYAVQEKEWLIITVLVKYF